MQTTVISEVFHVKLLPSDILCFMEEGKLVNQFFSTVPSFMGLDIVLVNEGRLVIVFNFNSIKALDKALPLILNGCIMKKWMTKAIAFSHQPVIISRYISNLNCTVPQNESMV